MDFGSRIYNMVDENHIVTVERLCSSPSFKRFESSMSVFDQSPKYGDDKDIGTQIAYISPQDKEATSTPGKSKKAKKKNQRQKSEKNLQVEEAKQSNDTIQMSQQTKVEADITKPKAPASNASSPEPVVSLDPTKPTPSYKVD
jgi:hypothetical protein